VAVCCRNYLGDLRWRLRLGWPRAFKAMAPVNLRRAEKTWVPLAGCSGSSDCACRFVSAPARRPLSAPVTFSDPAPRKTDDITPGATSVDENVDCKVSREEKPASLACVISCSDAHNPGATHDG